MTHDELVELMARAMSESDNDYSYQKTGKIQPWTVRRVKAVLQALTDAGIVLCKGEAVAFRYDYLGAQSVAAIERLPFKTTWTETPLYAALPTPPKETNNG